MSIALVENTYYVSNSNSNTGYTTPAINTTGADFLVIGFSSYYSISSIWKSSYFSDSKGNNWTFLSQTGNATSKYGGIAYCVPTSVGAGHTVSLAANTAVTYGSLAFMAFSGVNQAAPYDTQTSAIDANSPGSITPAGSGELFVSQVTFYTYASTPTVNSPFTATLAAGYLNGARIGAAAAYYIASDAASVNPTWTMGTSLRGVSMTAFKPAAETGHPTAKRHGGIPFSFQSNQSQYRW